MAVLPLADELLLLGYDHRSGRPIMRGAILDLVLAAALIAELVMADRVHVIDKRLFVADHRAMSDESLDPVVAYVRHGHSPTIRECIRLLRAEARGLVLQRLSGSGLVTLVRSRRPGSHGALRVQPTDELAAFGPWLRLSYFISLGEPARADVPTATLAALAHVLRVDQRPPQLEIAASRRQVREWMAGAAAVLPPALKQVVKAADAAVEATIMQPMSR